MATYKNRQVDIIQEIPHGVDNLVKILHREAGLGTEIVPAKEVTVSETEMKNIESKRSDQKDFKVELVEKKHTGSVTFKKDK